RSSFEAELVDQSRGHNVLVRSVQCLAPWNVVLLRAGLSQTDVALPNVCGIKVGNVRRKPTPNCTEDNHGPVTNGWLEDKPDTRLETQFFVQSSAELLSLGSREVPASSPVHKLVTLNGRKAGPECEITIMKFDTSTKSLNHAPRQMNLKRIIS